MIFEVIALGLLSAVRPATSQAAVVALLRTPEPRRSLLGFTLAGLLVSMVIGMVVVVAFNGVDTAFGPSRFPATFDVVAGLAALAIAGALQRGQLAERFRSRRAAADGHGPSRLAARLRHPTV